MTWRGVLWLRPPPLPPPAPLGTHAQESAPSDTRSLLAQQVLSLGWRPSSGCQPMPFSTAPWEVPVQNVRLKRDKAIS